MLIVVLLLVDVVCGNNQTNTSLVTFASNDTRRSYKDPLLNQLRNRLMQDNYDYEPSASTEQETVLRAEADDYMDNFISREEAKRDDSELSDFPVDRNVLNGYISDLQSDDGDDQDNNQGDRETRADVDENVEEMKDEWIEVIKSFVPGSPYLYARHTTTQLPYKILTAHLEGQSRRSGIVHRYLKTELNDTVVVAAFSPGPLPLFRLPKSRRQYREDSDGDNITGEDDEANPT